MKKKSLFGIAAAVLVIVLASGCTKGYETQKIAGDVKVTLSADRYPLVKGDNTLNVKVDDAAGKTVSDAKVSVRYYMPAMPGMAPMEYSTEASAKGSAYGFAANIPMEGGWKVDVTVTTPGKPAITTTFNVDAR
jgi:hypothetical protein